MAQHGNKEDVNVLTAFLVMMMESFQNSTNVHGLSIFNGDPNQV